MPGGVPGVPPPPPPLPPQPLSVSKPANRASPRREAHSRLRRGVASKNTPTREREPPANRNMRACKPAGTETWGAVVMTVRVVEPTPVTEAGLKLQVAPKGRPAQADAAKFTVPV